jgi:hypothetical protein
MFAIKSVFLPQVDKLFDAKFVANVFERNGIAKVSKVYFESKNKIYNRAYIGIETWKDTETAYSFINRLRTPKKETRIIYKDDDWWSVRINKYPHKLTKNNRILTVFTNKENDDLLSIETDCDDEFSIQAVGFAEEIEENKELNIDYTKTELLKNIINLTTKYNEPVKENKKPNIDYEKTELLKNIINTLTIKQQEHDEFESYLTEAYNNRDLWYMYDTLDM